MTDAPRSPWVADAPDTPNVVPPPDPVTEPQIEHADHDVLIARPDLGPGAATLVKAGDPIPRTLADHERTPLDGSAAKRRRK